MGPLDRPRALLVGDRDHRVGWNADGDRALVRARVAKDVCRSLPCELMGTGFSFELVNADDYDALRPDYAWEAIAWVAERGDLGDGSLVVDLAAGTGQLSRRLAVLGVKLVAVEPARNMRAVIEHRLPAVRVLEGSAEAIPLGVGEADAVVVGNAFHHFEGVRRDSTGAASRWRLALFWAWPAEKSAAKRASRLDEVLERVRRNPPGGSRRRRVDHVCGNGI